MPQISMEEMANSLRELQEEVAHHKRLLQQITQSLPKLFEENLIETTALPSNVKQIEVHRIQQYRSTSGLRTIWLTQVYRKHLKQYAYVRRLVAWTWRNGYPIYANYLAAWLFNRKEKRWRSMMTLSAFAKREQHAVHQLITATPIEIPIPRVFPANEQCCLGIADVRYTFPEVLVATINNATIHGGTNLVLKGEEVICHDLYDFKRDSTSEELHGRTRIDPKRNRIRWLLHDQSPELMPIAATFIDACASNYAHWMTEVLPRIALFCNEKCFENVPIIVNDGLHPNIMTSLSLVVGVEREIIALPIGRAVHVAELYMTSATGYVPFDQRTQKLSGHSHGMFNSKAFQQLRNCLSVFAQSDTNQALPDKILLRRNSGTRKVANGAAIEKLLLAHGYVVIEPEKLSFLRQIQLFSNAKKIIGPTGAAFANAVFCGAGAKVVILMGKHEKMIYRYWLNMLAPLQVEVSYILGDVVKNRDLGIHGDFYISQSDVLDLLGYFERK